MINNNFHIESLEDRFRLYNVLYQGELYVVDWGKKLLDNGNRHTQDDWIERLRGNEWQLPSGLVYHASLAALHYNQNHEDKKQRKLIKQCREMHAEDFQYKCMITSTKIIYTPQGMDKIIHDYGSPTQKERELAFVGPHKYVTKDSGLEQEMRALLGTNDLEEIKKVYYNLTGQKPCLWRVNNKPHEEAKRALVLGVNGIDYYEVSVFNIIAVSFVVRSGRGVVVSPQGASLFYDSSLRGALSLVGNAGNISLVDNGNLSLGEK